MKNEKINITKSFLPPIEEYIEYLEKIWETNQLTNNGPLVKDLENKLKSYLSVKLLFFVTNGTIALQLAIKSHNLTGGIITTPFSYVATTSSIIWEGCHPVFVDIDPNTLCIDPNLIEQAITEDTSAILATHVYGIPCDVNKIEKIAQKHNLKIIYDAAHAFGVKYQDRPLVSFGNTAILSFHATKLFHTVEGGAIITDDKMVAHRISYMRNFGHKGQEDFWGLGINGKNSEFHAAMGLCLLNHISEIILARKQVSDWYDEFLEFSALKRPVLPKSTQYNYSYYPVIFSSEIALLKIREDLNLHGIYPRRYFYPSLTSLPYTESSSTHIADDISKRILCLPISHDLNVEVVKKIADLINKG